jgi:hypothetical protein
MTGRENFNKAYCISYVRDYISETATPDSNYRINRRVCRLYSLGIRWNVQHFPERTETKC